MALPCPDDAHQEPQTRRTVVPLPLLADPTGEHHRPGRPFTCLYRCGNACAHEPPNPTENPYFGDVLRSAIDRRTMDRRGVLKAGAVLSMAAGGAYALAGCATPEAAAAPAAPAQRAGRAPKRPTGLEYTPVAPNLDDRITVPDGYDSNVVIRWGDAVVPGAPAFDFDRQSAAAQQQQFGYNNDFCGLVSLPGAGERYTMFCNHEYTIEPLMFRGYDANNPTVEQVRIAQAAHGLTVVVVERDRRTGEMTPVADRTLNRRYHTASAFTVTGPAAGSPLLRTAADPAGRTVLGTLNNCAGGVTPWGTFLSGEENVNQYFANAAQVADPTTNARLRRYGFTQGASERKWERFDDRFDLAKTPNEANRFGWIVEVDPQDPSAPPVKHTALGRFKHEGATIHLTRDGRAVAYMGDDEVFDYVYKFVSDEKMMRGNSRRAREHNRTLLTKGTLYVAKFTGDSPRAEITGNTAQLPADGRWDGSGEWIKLAAGTTSFVPGMTADEVYVYTREAGDKVGATRMDRPEDVEANPRTGAVYLALTNNSGRGRGQSSRDPGVDEANPRGGASGNRHGHVIELNENGRDADALAFTWNVLLVCGNPTDADTYFGGFDKSQVSPITAPDNLAFDDLGNLWISTDSGRALGINDGLYGVSLEGDTRGWTTMFASVPAGAECCGPVVTDQFVLISPQHPGDLDGASPATPKSTWPDGAGSQPRPSVVNIWKVGPGGRPGRIGR